MAHMRSSYIFFVLLAAIGMFFGSCKKEDDSSTTPTATSSFWKQTAKQYWWIPRDQNNQFAGPMVQIQAVPYNTFYTVSGYSYYIGGMEYNFTCWDSAHTGGTKTHTFTWDVLPARMVADTLYPIGAQVSGPWAGGLSISNSADYSVNDPNFTNNWILQAFISSGRVTGSVRIPKPADVNHPRRMAIMVSISSAYTGPLEYIYIYDWVTE